MRFFLPSEKAITPGKVQPAVQKSTISASDRPRTNSALVERLRQAVRKAGGNQAVAERSGVPLATVNNYVRGRNGMKMETLTALAAACGVSLAWLSSGDPRPAPGFAPAFDTIPPGLADAPLPATAMAEAGIDVASLAKAIEIVRAVTGNDALDGAPDVVARRLTSVYAVLMQPAAIRD